MKLRPVERRDLELIRSWRNSDAVARFHANRDHISARQQVEWFEAIRSGAGWRVWVIEDATDSARIGVGHFKDIEPRHRRAECGLYIALPERRTGLRAMETFHLLLEYGFEELDLHKIYGHYLVENDVARRLNDAFGFFEEARYRDELHYEGEFHDYIRVAVFEPRYRNSSGARFFAKRRRREQET